MKNLLTPLAVLMLSLIGFIPTSSWAQWVQKWIVETPYLYVDEPISNDIIKGDFDGDGRMELVFF